MGQYSVTPNIEARAGLAIYGNGLFYATEANPAGLKASNSVLKQLPWAWA